MKFVDFTRNNLNKFVLFTKKSMLFIMSTYFKYNIRLLKFITENPLGYLIYIFLVAYGLYGGKSPDFETGKIIAVFIASYFLNTGIVFYILSRISFITQFLENLLTKEFIYNYLGLHVTSKIIIRLLLPLPGLFALEIFGRNYFSTQAQNVVRDIFFTNYGTDMVNWSEQVKYDYITDMTEAIKKNIFGPVSNTMNGELIRSLVSMIHNIVENIIKIIFKK